MKWLLLLALGAIVGCSQHQPVEQALSPDAHVTSLSSDQEKRLCDWTARLFGGYDRERDCDGGVQAALVGPTDQGSCVSQLNGGFGQETGAFSGCPATVDDVEQCFAWKVDNYCLLLPGEPADAAPAAPDACAIVNDPKCAKP